MMVAADATDLHSIGGEPQLPLRLGALLHLAGAQAAFIMAAADATDLNSIGGSLSFPPDLELYFISRARRPPS